jgi:hypothetical protein
MERDARFVGFVNTAIAVQQKHQLGGLESFRVM